LQGKEELDSGNRVSIDSHSKRRDDGNSGDENGSDHDDTVHISDKSKEIDSETKTVTQDVVELADRMEDFSKWVDGENPETLDLVNADEGRENVGVNDNIDGDRLNVGGIEKRNDENVERLLESDEHNDESKIETDDGAPDADDVSADLFEGWDKSDEDENQETRDKENDVERKSNDAAVVSGDLFKEDELPKRDADNIERQVDEPRDDENIERQVDEPRDDENVERQIDQRRVDDEDVDFEKQTASDERETSEQDDNQLRQSILSMFTNIIKSPSGEENKEETVDDSRQMETDDKVDRRSESAERDAENAEMYRETYRVFGDVSIDDGSASKKDMHENKEEIDEKKAMESTSPIKDGDNNVRRPVNGVDSQPGILRPTNYKFK